MGAVLPVIYTTPDGVERPLRFTMGARRRIAIEFGTANIQTILQQYDYGAVPRLVYQLLYDDKGQAPAFTVQEFEESFPNDSDVGDAAIAAVMSAALQGRIAKKDLEAAIKEYQQNPTGLNSGHSEPAISASQTSSSGDSIPPSSTPSPGDTASANDSPIIAPV